MRINLIKQGQLLVFSSFFGLIAVGTLLLKLPFSVRDGAPKLAWIDALFTSVSASCVTGLSTYETIHFSAFGQLVITLLMEFGGIGVVTLSTAILIMIGRTFSRDREKMISEIIGEFTLWGSSGLFIAVLVYTLICEAIGFVIIYVGALYNGNDWVVSIGQSAMLSVAGFCNAGFAPFADNMASQSRISQFGCALLTIFGGFGVCVVHDLFRYCKEKYLCFCNHGVGSVNPLQLHTRIMLWGTFFLLFGGMFGLYCAESKWTLFDSFFMSVSARTAGFSCCVVESDVGYNILLFLMNVGGGSGGTAGGIKVTTFVIACAAIVNTSIGNKEVHLFRCTINQTTVMRSFSLIIYFQLLLFFSFLLLEYLSPNVDPVSLYFDAISALSTTGLTEGAVVELGVPGKIVMSLLMYTGRVGPLTFLLFLFGRDQLKQRNYSEGDVIIG